jgi:oxygen-dependent protoporphyrinogen oxidase
VQGLEGVDGRWRVKGVPFEAPFDQVLLTTSASAVSRLRVGDQTPFEFLNSIPHPPVTVLNVGFPREAVRHPLDGFGCLVPAAERRSILGIIFTSTLFPGRAPAGHVAFTVMLGGSLQPDLAKPSASEAWKAAQSDVQALLGIGGQAPAFLEATHYPSAIPQYTLAHASLLSKMEAAEQALPGLILGGNFRRGISLPDRIGQTV